MKFVLPTCKLQTEGKYVDIVCVIYVSTVQFGFTSTLKCRYPIHSSIGPATTSEFRIWYLCRNLYKFCIHGGWFIVLRYLQIRVLAVIPRISSALLPLKSKKTWTALKQKVRNLTQLKTRSQKRKQQEKAELKQKLQSKPSMSKKNTEPTKENST